MSIPFLDVGATYRELKTELDAAIQRVLDSGWYILGDEVESFEQAWAKACGADHAVGVGTGLDALVLGLRALGIGPGDEVIVPAHTFVATALAVTYAGGTPVFADVDLGTGNLTAELAAPHITPRTKAILVVHLYGQPADLDGLLELTRAHGLHLVEDAAQAHGATYKGKPLGAHGAFAAWSFYPGKNLGAFGDGGALTTHDDALAEKVRTLRNYGSPKKYVHEEAGVNSRLDSLQAAVLGVKLAHLDAWNARRAKLAAVYDDALPRALVQPMERGADRMSSWHLYVVRTAHREKAQAALADAGIGTVVHYPIPCHTQPVYASARQGPFPNAERLGAEVLSLPIGPQLGVDQVHQVAATLRSL